MLTHEDVQQIKELQAGYEATSEGGLSVRTGGLFKHIFENADDDLSDKFRTKAGDVSATVAKRFVQEATTTTVIKTPLRPNWSTIEQFIEPNLRARKYVYNFCVGTYKTIVRWNYMSDAAKEEFLELYGRIEADQSLTERMRWITPDPDGPLLEYLRSNPHTRKLKVIEVEYETAKAAYQLQLKEYEDAKVEYESRKGKKRGKKPKRPRKPKLLNALQREMKTLGKRERQWEPPTDFTRTFERFLRIHDQLQMFAEWKGSPTGRRSSKPKSYTYNPMKLALPGQNDETFDWYALLCCLRHESNIDQVAAVGEPLRYLDRTYSYSLSAGVSDFTTALKNYFKYLSLRKNGKRPSRKVGPPSFRSEVKNMVIQDVALHHGGADDLREGLSADGKRWEVHSDHDYFPYLKLGGMQMALGSSEDGIDCIRIPRSQYRRIMKAGAFGGYLAQVEITRQTEALKGDEIGAGDHYKKTRGQRKRRKRQDQGPKTRYFASVTLTAEPVPVVSQEWDPDRVLGIDPGARKFLTLSDGTMVGDLNVLLGALDEQRKAAQKTMDRWLGPKHRKTKRGKGYARAQRRLSKISAQIAQMRRHEHEKTIDALLQMPYDYFAIEATELANLMRSPKGTPDLPGKNVKAASSRTRRILSQAIGRFVTRLTQRAKRVGKVVLLIPPAYTSRRCNACGEHNDPGSSETYKCEACGLVEDRDVNAAKNIRADGIKVLEEHGPPPVGGEWSARKAASE